MACGLGLAYLLVPFIIRVIVCITVAELIFRFCRVVVMACVMFSHQVLDHRKTFGGVHELIHLVAKMSRFGIFPRLSQDPAERFVLAVQYASLVLAGHYKKAAAAILLFYLSHP